MQYIQTFNLWIAYWILHSFWTRKSQTIGKLPYISQATKTQSTKSYIYFLHLRISLLTSDSPQLSLFRSFASALSLSSSSPLIIYLPIDQ